MAESKERELERELERQLENLGDSVLNGLQNGFEDRGAGIGRSARAVAGAVRDVFRYNLDSNYGRGTDRQQPDPDPDEGVDEISRAQVQRQLMRKSDWLLGTGLGMLIPSSVFCGLLFIGGVILDEVFESMAGLQYLSTLGGLLVVGSMGRIFPILAGVKRIRARTFLRQIAAVVSRKGTVDVEELADRLDAKPREIRRTIKHYIARDWLPGWFDNKKDKLRFHAEELPDEPEEEPMAAPAERTAPAAQPEDEAKSYGPAIADFIHALELQRELMRDELAREQLEIMARTTRSIGSWVECHPEQQEKARKFVSYYMPTTLKLLHTYNQVQGQTGRNAETMRNDIGGMLHTLNIAYSNLYDGLLAETAMDVSSEIDVLSSMLKQDGLTDQGNLQL